MSVWSNDTGIDQALAWFADCNVMHVCSSQPADYSAMVTASLGSVSVTAGDGNGDFAISDGDSSGRKLTMAVQTIEAATASDSGTTLHLAIANTTDSTLRYVTTIPEQAVTVGNPISTGSWKVEILDPA